MSLTLNMIVKNEEKLLPACLKSIKDWVDEIIIVDTGSTDSTVSIAEGFGAKVHHFAWCDDFSQARNFAKSFVKTPWLLWMDADDLAFNPHLLKDITQNAHKRRCNAIWSTYKQDEVSYQRRLQIFKPSQFSWEGIVHENPIPNRPALALHDMSEFIVIHRKPKERRTEAAVRYLDMLLANDKDNWLGLAESYRYLSVFPDDLDKVTEYKKAAEHYYWEAANHPEVNTGTKYISLFNCARISMELAAQDKDKDRLQYALNVAEMARQLLPHRAEALIILGQISEAANQTLQAKAYFEEALSKPQPDDIGLVYQDYYDRIPKTLLKRLDKAA